MSYYHTDLPRDKEMLQVHKFGRITLTSFVVRIKRMEVIQARNDNRGKRYILGNRRNDNRGKRYILGKSR